MGHVVLHLEKAKGNDSGMSAHIERTVHPKNADESRTHLNREMITFPQGVNNRTEAIQYRLDNAGLARKIGTNQVRAIRIMLSGTPEDMQHIEKGGKLSGWCNDNLQWLYQNYGAENVVSAVLHLDEKTPHIHATIVPIVTGERRKAKKEESNTATKKYKKKSKETARLCADDIMARDKLKYYQDSYAATMSKYGLQRGIEGSEARHISTSEYYRELFSENQHLQENLNNLVQQQEQAKQELSKIKSEIKTDKLKNTAINVAATAIEGIGTVFGSSKVKKQQQEIENLKEENTTLNTNMEQLTQRMRIAEAEHRKITDKLQQELKKIYDLFPHVRELLHIERLCQVVGFTLEKTKELLTGKPFRFNGSLYSPEHKRKFDTEQSIAQVVKAPEQSGKLLLAVDGKDITDWFRDKYKQWLESIGIKRNPEEERKHGQGL